MLAFVTSRVCPASAQAGAQAELVSPKVIVTVDSGEEALTTRLRQEMEALGLTVIVHGNSAASDTRASADPNVDTNVALTLESEARKLDAIAAVRVLDTRSGTVEMTIIDRATGKTVQRRLVIATPSDPAAAELIAVRTVELLRASLMELHSAHPARGEVRITKKVEAIAAVPNAQASPETTHRTRFAAGAGFGWAYAPGWSNAASVGATGVVYFDRHWGGQVGFVVPLESMQRSSFAGTASLEWSQVRVGVGRVQRFRYVAVDAYVGADAARLRFDAKPNVPYLKNPSESVAYGAYAALGVDVPIYGVLAMRLEQYGGMHLRKTVVRLAGVEVSAFGRPVAATTLGLRLEWP
jgi:hypothetical protein